MDPRFNAIFTSPENDVFKVVFYPDRIYHAEYLNATRSPRYRYNVLEVRSEVDITLLKCEVYLDGKFLCNALRIEYRAGRLVEQVREKNRFLRDQILANIDVLPEWPRARRQRDRQAPLRRVDRRLPGRNLGDPGASPDGLARRQGARHDGQGRFHHHRPGAQARPQGPLVLPEGRSVLQRE